MAAGETKLSLLNSYIGSLPGSALLYVVIDGVSYKVTKDDLLAGIIGGNLFTQLIAIGETTIDGNDITIAAGTMGQLGASVYTTTSPQTFTVPFSSAGKVRTDIIVLNTSSVLVLVSGTEGDVAVQPAIPANTILVTKIEVTESGIGAFPEPTYLTIEERAAITYANNPNEDNPFATMDDLEGLGGVQSVGANWLGGVDNTDPENPVIQVPKTKDILATPDGDRPVYIATYPITTSTFSLIVGEGCFSLLSLTNETLSNDLEIIVPESSTYTTIEFRVFNGSDHEVTLSPDTGVTLLSDTLVIPKNYTAIIKSVLAGEFPTLLNFNTYSVTYQTNGVEVDLTGYATEAYVDNKVAGLLDLRGNYDASGNVFPSTGGSGTAGAILKGDFWYISVAGTLGGESVHVGDSIYAKIDSPTSSDWEIMEANLSYIPEDVANKTDTMAGNTASSTKYLSAKGVFDYIASVLVNATASVRGIVKLYTSTGSNTDGTMDQNSITNALATKQNKNRYVYQPKTSITGVTGAQIITSFKISGTAYENLADGFNLTVGLKKSVTATTIDYQVFLGTTINSLSSQIARFITNANTRGVDIKRDFFIDSGFLDSTTGFNANILNGSVSQNTTENTPIAVNMDNDLWITIVGNPTVITEVVGIGFASITPLK